MIESDNKKLDLLLSLRELVNNEIAVINNNSARIDSFYLASHDNESNEVYHKLKHYITKREERDKQEREQLLQDLTRIIDRTCCHEFVDDEIEHVYSGNLVKVRYCCICEKTV